jgi:Kef-type K+ transport system membrane component KefB
VENLTIFIFQLGIIMICARVGGYISDRFLHMPRVVGELCIGILIGPYALGRVDFTFLSPLLVSPLAPESVADNLHAFASFAAVLLLFMSGLETDLRSFLRYSTTGLIVGLGGVIFSFTAGAGCAVWFGAADSLLHPAALFLGAVATATSVGITARVLSERRKTDTAEGVTILGAAVLDDVLSILVLAVVVGMVKAEEMGATPDWSHLAWLSLKALGFWVAATVVCVGSARYIARVLKVFQSSEVMASLALGLGLILAAVSESVGLAMIIGGYTMGLALSRTDLGHLIRHQLQGVYNVLVPVFFCINGMLVDLSAMRHVLVFGLVYTALAMGAKHLGCGLPAWFREFNLRGANRIGLGMVPRGEVALIIAGIGLSAGAIGHDLFGVAILMTLVTTIFAPVALSRSFTAHRGTKARVAEAADGESRELVMHWPSEDLARFFVERLARAFQQEEFFVYLLGTEETLYQIRKDDIVMSLNQKGSRLTLRTRARDLEIGRLILLEEFLDMKTLLENIRDMESLDTLPIQILNNGESAPAASDQSSSK